MVTWREWDESLVLDLLQGRALATRKPCGTYQMRTCMLLSIPTLRVQVKPEGAALGCSLIVDDSRCANER